MKDAVSRPTPDPVARQLRQEAGFGCCKCGHPIFQYHHIIPYSAEEHFRPEDMMVLCPNCHDEATQGAMSIVEQRRYKAQPYNIKRGYAKGVLKVNEQRLIVSAGNNKFVGGGPLIKVDGEELISFQLGVANDLKVSLKLYDEQDDLLVSIQCNEWMSGENKAWDIEFGYQRLRARKKKGSIDLSIDLRKSPVVLRANLWRKGKLISISPEMIRVDRQQTNWNFIGSTFVGSYISIQTFPQVYVTVEPGIIR